MQRCKLLTFLPLVLIAASCSRDPKVQAQRYVENGNKFYARAKYKEASIMYRRALQKDLRFGEAYYRLGLTDLKLHRRLLVPAGILAFEERPEKPLLQRFAIGAVEMREVGIAMHL